MSGFWTTASGERIPISRMSDSHLANAVQHLRRRLREIDASISDIARMIAECPQDDDAFERLDIEHEHQQTTAMMIDSLLNEVRRRNEAASSRSARINAAMELRGEIIAIDGWE